MTQRQALLRIRDHNDRITFAQAYRVYTFRRDAKGNNTFSTSFQASALTDAPAEGGDINQINALGFGDTMETAVRRCLAEFDRTLDKLMSGEEVSS